MPLQATSGAASYDAFGGGAAAKVNYIENFFQSYLRTGTGASATVTTGLDGSTKETLVWTKSRSAATNHKLTDNVRGATKALSSNTIVGETTDSQGLTAFSATGYTIGTNTDYNNSGATYVDWQLVSQPKFFDVVTWTGNGTAGRTISHNLGSTPGCIIVKNLFSDREWAVYHRSNGGTPQNNFLRLNTTKASVASSIMWNNTAPTDTTFTVGSGLYEDPGSGDYTSTNESGDPYVAYLFAHNAGGFGLTGTDNVISCGSFTTDGSAKAVVNLGWEPQWILHKRDEAGESWRIADNMRGWQSDGTFLRLQPNTSGAEANTPSNLGPTATGFETFGNAGANANFIYIAIRRGPMKVPTSGTSVFTPITFAGTGVANQQGSLAGDMYTFGFKDAVDGINRSTIDRLRGGGTYLLTHSTNAETTAAGQAQFYKAQNGVQFTTYFNGVGNNMYMHEFKRAPSFFDVVCYTGTGSARTVAHNLGAVPELMIVKKRNTGGDDWYVYSQPTGNQYATYLNLTYQGDSGSSAWNSTSPTSSVFSLGASGGINGSGSTFVAYLFATCAGVSKCTSFTGTGTLQTIDCGFTSGSRFVLIKRTDSTGDWYVWDSSRGLSSSTDPYLLLNSTAAEVTSTNWVDTTSTGFQVTAASGNNVNINGASYIALAIA